MSSLGNRPNRCCGGTAEAPRRAGHCGRARSELGEKFFQEIIQPPGAAGHEHPQGAQALFAGIGSVPVADLPHLHAPRARLRLSWRQPLPSIRRWTRPRQETTSSLSSDFRRKDCLRELVKIKTAWPISELCYRLKGVLILEVRPSRPSIPCPSTRGSFRLVEGGHSRPPPNDLSRLSKFSKSL